jgi:hypothetical protein
LIAQYQRLVLAVQAATDYIHSNQYRTQCFGEQDANSKRASCNARFCIAVSISGVAAADELAEFNTAVEKAAAHWRVALELLRTGHLRVAAREIADMKIAWSELVSRFAAKQPDAFDGNALYGETLTDVATRIVTATIMLNFGRPASARDALMPVRSSLSNMRRASSVYVLADCVLDANTTLDALIAFGDTPPDWSKSDDRLALTTRATACGEVLRRCDRIAPAKVHSRAQFRRPIDGALTLLAQVPGSIAHRDGELLRRILTELRSLDRLLVRGYG